MPLHTAWRLKRLPTVAMSPLPHTHAMPTCAPALTASSILNLANGITVCFSCLSGRAARPESWLKVGERGSGGMGGAQETGKSNLARTGYAGQRCDQTMKPPPPH